MLIALLGAVALIAMHGVSAHGIELSHEHEAFASEMSHDDHVGHDHAGDHGDDHGDGQPCNGCSHDMAALCALIVLGIVAAAVRISSRLQLRQDYRPRPPSRSWSPDPPVPKFALVPLQA